MKKIGLLSAAALCASLFPLGTGLGSPATGKPVPDGLASPASGAPSELPTQAMVEL
jgi:hypothetical protein